MCDSRVHTPITNKPLLRFPCFTEVAGRQVAHLPEVVNASSTLFQPCSHSVPKNIGKDEPLASFEQFWLLHIALKD